MIDKLEQDVLQGYSGQSSPLTRSSDEIVTPLPINTSQAPRVDSMLKIVCTQRDRFQAKLQKVELVSRIGIALFFLCDTDD